MNQLAYVRADPTQQDTLTLPTDAAIAEMMGCGCTRKEWQRQSIPTASRTDANAKASL
ncbi:hypothetical protein [Mesorhizobium sp. B2-3-12]|uniref:hypothetical protein n=1 Tax=Mesorhizobium sp. B2-3-12 TaxID=2589952 RepID=UPI0015E41110|nr:hypothetical protein [Mesorhizobium sp. B2-3-12]